MTRLRLHKTLQGRLLGRARGDGYRTLGVPGFYDVFTVGSDVTPPSSGTSGTVPRHKFGTRLAEITFRLSNEIQNDSFHINGA